MSEMSEAFLSALWRASWQGSLVIAALWCISRVLESRHWLSADLRCWLWRLGYIKLLFGLVSGAVVALPVLPHNAPVGTPWQAGYGQAVAAHPMANAVFGSLPTLPEAAKTGSPTASVISWQVFIVLLYLLGVGVCFFRVVRAGMNMRRVLRDAVSSSDAELNEEAARLAPLCGLRDVPRLAYSSKVSVPSYAARTVLLPANAPYPTNDRRLILAHELAHARRRDLAWEWLGTLVHLVFFFHPLVMVARREERLARESAADADALRVTCAPASAYADLLLRVSLARPNRALVGVIGIMDSGVLFRRLLSLKGTIAMNPSRNAVSSAAFVLAVSAVVFVPWKMQAMAQVSQGAKVMLSPYSSAKGARAKARFAIASGDTKAATKYALQVLNSLATTTDMNLKTWDHGNVVHQENQILGLAALQEGRIADAKSYLIAAGNTSGSPQLDSFGPDMVLAQRLLNKGEKDVVIQYLDLVARFWAHSSDTKLAQMEKSKPGSASLSRSLNQSAQKQIDNWKQQIEAGQKPKLNMSNALL